MLQPKLLGFLIILPILAVFEHYGIRFLKNK